MTVAFAVTYWVLLFLFLAWALAGSILAWRRPSRRLTLSAAAALGAAIIVATIPGPTTPIAIAIILGTLCLALAAIGGGPAATTTLQLAMRDSAPAGAHGGILLENEGRREVLRGGLTIGILERIAVAGALLAGFPAGIAVVVAVKGVGRFTELNAAEAQERFIIGTFVSLIWACAAAAVVMLVVA